MSENANQAWVRLHTGFIQHAMAQIERHEQDQPIEPFVWADLRRAYKDIMEQYPELEHSVRLALDALPCHEYQKTGSTKGGEIKLNTDDFCACGGLLVYDQEGMVCVSCGLREAKAQGERQSGNARD